MTLVARLTIPDGEGKTVIIAKDAHSAAKEMARADGIAMSVWISLMIQDQYAKRNAQQSIDLAS